MKSTVGFDEIDAVVRHLGLLRRGRLGGADVHPAVHLHAVGRHEVDAAEAAGDGQGDRGLPRRGRADDRNPTGVDRAAQSDSPSAMR